MILSLIAAMAENRVIGSKGAIPWHLPADLRHFQELTTGHPVIMGRKTYESIGRPLPGRRTLILSRNSDFRVDGAEVFPGLEEALQACDDANEIFVCGGAEIYRIALAKAARIYLTVVHRCYEGDTFFPEIPGDFREVLREEREGPPPFSLLLLERSPYRSAT